MGILRSDRVSGLGGANAINGSVHFPNDGATGTGDYLRVDRKDNSDFNLSTNDFTIEFWFYSENVSSTLHPLTFAAPTVSASSDAGFYIRFNGGVVNANCFQSTNTIGGVSTGSVSAYTWYHVAYVRSGSTFTIYLNGTSAATASSSAAVNYDAGWNLNIGSAYTNTYHYNGYLSNVRIVNGTALYTSNFTVPNRLEAVENTVLLCCQSPGNVLQEASGKALHLVGTSNANKFANASHFAPDVGEDHGTTFGDNTKFDTQSYMVPPGGTTTESNRGRAIFMGGYLNPSLRSEIYYVQMQSQGNAVLFGDLSGDNGGEGSSCASSTRALQGGGSLINTINYITIATTSNSTDFGDITVARRSLTALSSNTRGIWAGGTTNPAMSDVIDYATIATTGNATDFGNLTEGRRNPAVGSITSTTRGVFAGGNPGSSPLYTNVIDYITIASTGNATDFGDQVLAMREQGGASSSIRGLIAGGHTSPANLNRIEYITIASTGNAADFGDLNITPGAAAGTSNKTRALFAGGSSPYNNSMEYVTIATTGDAKDFGDLPVNRMFYGGTSDSHGGIS